MEKEIKKPYLDTPKFSKVDEPSYDYRNVETPGRYQGVGEAGKVGKKGVSSDEPMPKEPMKMKVPRKYER